MVYNGIHIRKVREILTELNKYTMTKENYTLLMWKKLEYKDIYFEDLEFEEVQKIEKVIDLAFSLYSVSQQRELLNALADNFNESTHTYVGQPMIEETLKAFNCG